MDFTQLNSQALAYLGDAVYELEVRKYLLNKGIIRVKDLHSAAIKMVRAGTQARVIHHILPALNEMEAAVVRRGRNAKPGMVPKNAEIIDYRYASAFEALIGYWYLTGNQDKITWAFGEVVSLLEVGPNDI